MDGSLSKAFQVDGIIDQLTECILAGRNPIITGESGIGKTSMIHELVRRIESGSTLGNLKVSMIKSGLSDMRRPFGTFLFMGPTGVAKTHLAQFLAEVLFFTKND